MDTKDHVNEFLFYCVDRKGKKVKNKIGKFIVVQQCLGFLYIRFLFAVNTYVVYSDKEKIKSICILSFSSFFIYLFIKLKHEPRYMPFRKH